MDEKIRTELMTQTGKTVFVFIGNDLRADDGAGPYIAKNIRNDSVKIINAETVFENYVEEIIELKPDKIVIFDCAFFDGKPGEIKLLDENKLLNYKMISTHSFPLNALINVIKSDLKNIKVIIIGIQPESVDYKEGLSENVKKSSDEIINFINSL
ncbi:MAG: hydrogenase maturation peptidase HycI [Elusimicrobia bacterium]|nr:hydrogenase maturation peptidase HycI [Elusimicrobiota bacterium]